MLVGDFELVLDAWMGLEYVVVDKCGNSVVPRSLFSATSRSVEVGRSGSCCKPPSGCKRLIRPSEPTGLGRTSRTFRSASVLGDRVLPDSNERLEPRH